MTVTLAHRVEGPADAPVLVLLSSLGTDMGMWAPQAEALRDEFRLVRCDTRGHGGSAMAPPPWTLADLGGDVLALLDSLGIARASFAGVSLGGSIAIWIAAHAPERVERLIPCFTSAYFGPPNPWLERAATVREEGVEAVVDAVLDRWFTDRVDPDLRARMRKMMVGVPREGYAAATEVVAHLDLREDLARITVPTLVLAGGEDPACPPPVGRALAEGIPGAELTVLEGAAHLGNLERPAPFTALLRNHLGVDGPKTQDPLEFSAHQRGRHEKGMKVRREVLGDAHVDRAEARKDAFTEDFQDFITRYAWGEIWDRPGLDRRARSVATLAALISLRAENEIAMHVRAALRNGLTPDEIKEVILHTAIYAGLPAANAAFAIAQEVIAEGDAPA
ncbi:MAG: 3-oxoadipate enol-lactonase [Actinobacteria bacterium]|nr:3-oxoadipate enol-lactonase [Actinomycetota bacterium]